ncbi:MAG: hypothetical protein KAJ14_03285 [Candidatus Omnitrophica bacterium]|nr:hypothetical protein [Candidatus Omnitrophota bacterium]
MKKNILQNSILVASLIIIVFLFVFDLYSFLVKVPQAKVIFSMIGGRLPAITKIVIAISDFLRKGFLLVIPIILFVLCGGFAIVAKKKQTFIIFNIGLLSLFLIFAFSIYLAINLPCRKIGELLECKLSYHDLQEKYLKERSFKFTAKSKKDVYTAGEDIVFAYELKNVNREKQQINTIIAPGGNIRIAIYDPNNMDRWETEPKIKHESHFWENPKENDLKFLNPGESIKGEIKFPSLDHPAGTYEVNVNFSMWGVVGIKELPLVFSEWLYDEFTIKEKK